MSKARVLMNLAKQTTLCGKFNTAGNTCRSGCNLLDIGKTDNCPFDGRPDKSGDYLNGLECPCWVESR